MEKQLAVEQKSLGTDIAVLERNELDFMVELGNLEKKLIAQDAKKTDKPGSSQSSKLGSSSHLSASQIFDIKIKSQDLDDMVAD